MLNLIFSPYQEELVYGWFTRYHIHSGNLSYLNSIEELYDKEYDQPKIYYPVNLGSFLEKLPTEWGYSVEYLIEKHTLFPYFRFFMNKKDVDICLKVIKGKMRMNIENKLGVHYEKTYRKYSVYICQNCFFEDIKEHGEPYIHREHQIPGKTICGKHMKYLYNISRDEFEPRSSFIKINKENSKVEKNNIPITQEIVNLSEDMEQIIYNNYLEHDIDFLKYKIDKMLKLKGYKINTLTHQSQLLRDFVSFYSYDFLQKFNSYIEPDDKESWIIHLTTNNQYSVNPIKQLLFIRFLFGGVKQLMEFNEEYSPFGKGPWPCLNPVAYHYQQNVITECEIKKNYKKKCHTGTFKCDCGFIYATNSLNQENNITSNKVTVISFGHTWELKLRDIINSGIHQINDISKIMKCSPTTIVKYAIELNINNLINTKKTELDYKKISNYDMTLKEYKAKILKFISDNKDSSRSFIRQSLRTEYMYTMKKDRQWIEDNIPLHQKTGRKDQIDWRIVDLQIKEKVIEAIKYILSLDEPVRVTIRNISKRINYTSIMVKNYLEQMPECKKIINQNIETTKQFKERKIRLLVKRMVENHENISKTNIARRVYLNRTEYKEFKQLIDELVDKYHHWL